MIYKPQVLTSSHKHDIIIINHCRKDGEYRITMRKKQIKRRLKKMKKVIALLMAWVMTAALLFALTGCGGNSGGSTDTNVVGNWIGTISRVETVFEFSSDGGGRMFRNSSSGFEQHDIRWEANGDKLVVLSTDSWNPLTFDADSFNTGVEAYVFDFYTVMGDRLVLTYRHVGGSVSYLSELVFRSSELDMDELIATAVANSAAGR
jgi:hypothetical protein